MIAVFRLLLISCRLSVKPGIIVLTFQLAIRSAGDFFVFRVFLGALLNSLLVKYEYSKLLAP